MRNIACVSGEWGGREDRSRGYSTHEVIEKSAIEHEIEPSALFDAVGTLRDTIFGDLEQQRFEKGPGNLGIVNYGHLVPEEHKDSHPGFVAKLASDELNKIIDESQVPYDVLYEIAASDIDPEWANGVSADVFAATAIIRANAHAIADSSWNLAAAIAQKY